MDYYHHPYQPMIAAGAALVARCASLFEPQV
jgi:hypothetical protein